MGFASLRSRGLMGYGMPQAAHAPADSESRIAGRARMPKHRPGAWGRSGFRDYAAVPP
jgi:hypothetical protein